MKRFFAIGATMLTVVFLVAPGIARAGILDLITFTSGVDAAQAVDPTLTPPPNDGAHDSAVGGGHYLAHVGGPCNNSEPDCIETGFSAHSGPAGQNPQGHVTHNTSKRGGSLRGDVVCLHVLGNQAFILAVETRTDDAVTQGGQFLLHVVDNGNPTSGQPPDLIRISFAGGFTRTTNFPCGLPFVPPNPLGSGNIVVHDEP